MRSGAQTDDGATGFEVVVHFLHLIVGQIAKTRCDDHEIRVSQGLEPRNIRGVVRVNDPQSLRILGEEHHGFEAVTFGQYFSQLREGLF